MSKKKLIILIVAVCFAVLAGVLAVVDVWASSEQQAENLFSVTVSASNVDANLMFSTRDKLGNVQQFPAQAEEEDVYYSISSTQSNSTNVYNLEKVSLTTENSYVIFVFNIVNSSAISGKAMKVSFTDNSKKDNVNCYYSFNSGADFEYLKDDENLALPADRVIYPQEEYVLYMAIEILDPTLSASYESVDGAGLTFLLQEAK